MNILLLEDQGSVSIYLKPLLEDRKHKVFEAYSIHDAESVLRLNVVDCLILDLNLSGYGLSKENEAETKEGLLTGWVWVKNIAFISHENLKKSTIIYSDYLNVLRKEISPAELDGIKLLAKREDASIDKLLDLVEGIDKERNHKIN